MKLLVVSDNHGDRHALVDLAAKREKEVDAMFHCGDSELPATDPLWQKFVVVQGNCDYDPGYQQKQVVEIGNERIFMTHGHLYQVNSGLMNLSLAGREENATIVLYGHTHRLGVEMNEGQLILNSGSISQPRGRFAPLKTYAIIEVSSDEFVVRYYNESHEEVTELTTTFNRN